MKIPFAFLFAATFICCHAFAADDCAHAPNKNGAMPATVAAEPPSAGRLPTAVARTTKRANFNRQGATRETRHTADWVVDSGDNRGLPFLIVDKVAARVFVFHADGRLSSAAPALLGQARGDDSTPGIGNRQMAGIRPKERTTPAGRCSRINLGVALVRATRVNGASANTTAG